ncbi:hypothetical protein MMC18_008650 [Xylographa bjoerkii]|nr:hypothetical protein [Xylographa bjoerkii]
MNRAAFSNNVIAGTHGDLVQKGACDEHLARTTDTTRLPGRRVVEVRHQCFGAKLKSSDPLSGGVDALEDREAVRRFSTLRYPFAGRLRKRDLASLLMRVGNVGIRYGAPADHAAGFLPYREFE